AEGGGGGGVGRGRGGAVAPAAGAGRATGRGMADSPAGSLALGALNGMLGDKLLASHPELALELTVRLDGRAVETDSQGLRQAFPHAGPRLAVFLHGLCETEGAWRLGSTPPFGSRLRDELGYTPLYVRYNTGLHVSDNGRRLSEVLEAVVTAWPVDVAGIVLVGHSMGGLVARSACRYGEGLGAE